MLEGTIGKRSITSLSYQVWRTNKTQVHATTASSSTTSLVSPRTKGLDLIGLDEPEDEILKEPEQHLPMHGRERATCD
jgi:hypothetical protein